MCVLFVQLVRVITGNSTVRLAQEYSIFGGPEALLPLPMAKKKKSKPRNRFFGGVPTFIVEQNVHRWARARSLGEKGRKYTTSGFCHAFRKHGPWAPKDGANASEGVLGACVQKFKKV